jgi:enamine deaminase RidA (YjgF/YER057c/UK114 family)
MTCRSYSCRSAAVDAQVARFAGADGVAEYHLVLQPSAAGDFAAQQGWVARAYRETLAVEDLPPGSAVWRRFFCSDLASQSAQLRESPLADTAAADECAISRVGMPPAPPARLALWAYHVRDSAGPLRKRRDGPSLSWERPRYTQRWTTGLSAADRGGAGAQTHAVLTQYDELLRAGGQSWLHDVQRTWLFVRDIGANYAGVVAARREFFAARGLTPATHFIASTGIEGHGVDPAALVTLDAYDVAGTARPQVTQLTAPEFLGPTHLYGVTFERGTALAYRDRTHLIISGTASIDPRGEIVHPGNLAGQLDRTLGNIAALLRAGGAGLDDLTVLIAYVRNPADLACVQTGLRRACLDVPVATLVAPVCRPGWLVEIEGWAIRAATRPELPPF